MESMEAVVSSASSWSTESAGQWSSRQAQSQHRGSLCEFGHSDHRRGGPGVAPAAPAQWIRSRRPAAGHWRPGLQESSIQLWKALMAANEPLDDEKPRKVTTYEALAETALGLWGRIFTAAVVNIFLLGVCSAYAALIGMQLYNLTGIFDQRSGSWLHLPSLWCSLCCPTCRSCRSLSPWACWQLAWRLSWSCGGPSFTAGCRRSDLLTPVKTSWGSKGKTFSTGFRCRLNDVKIC